MRKTMGRTRRCPPCGAVAALAAALIAAVVLGLGHPDVLSPAAAQQAGLVEISLSLAPAANVLCSDLQGKCFVDLASQFTVAVGMSAIPAGGYSGYELDVRHTGLTSKAVRYASVADFGITFPVVGVGSERFAAGALTATQLPFPTTGHLGTLVDADLNCSSAVGSFKISILLPNTKVKDTNGNDIAIATTLQGTDKVADSLVINCRQLAGDKDGDGCPTIKELGDNEILGGRRDPNNPWDYFNPTGDRQNRLDDVVAVVQQYFDDDTLGTPGQPPYSPGYNPDTDRTAIPGGNPWNLGPPNGVQRVDDILAQVKQYFHDC